MRFLALVQHHGGQCAALGRFVFFASNTTFNLGRSLEQASGGVGRCIKG